MKRHPALQDLSRDHFHALVRTQAIRKARSRSASKREWLDIATELISFATNDLEPHFQEEEDFILPLAGRSITLGRLVGNVRLEHDWLRAKVADLRTRVEHKGDVAPLLLEIESRLTKHVRFEENELFESLQRHVDEDRLQRMWRAAYAFRTANREPGSCTIHPGPPA